MRLPALAIIALLALSACGDKQIINHAQEVDVPVQATCDFTPPPDPVYVYPTLPATASLTDKVKAMLTDMDVARAYATQIKAAMLACNVPMD